LFPQAKEPNPRPKYRVWQRYSSNDKNTFTAGLFRNDKIRFEKGKNMMDSGKYLRSAFRALKKYLELRRDENNFQQFFTTKLALF
jgi:hypothetical protein